MKYFTKKEIQDIASWLHIEEWSTDEIWVFFEELIEEKKEEIIYAWERWELTVDSPYWPRNKFTLGVDTWIK